MFCEVVLPRTEPFCVTIKEWYTSNLEWVYNAPSLLTSHIFTPVLGFLIILTGIKYNKGNIKKRTLAKRIVLRKVDCKIC